jgi:hypothetical protein
MRVALRYVLLLPPPNWTCDFHRIRFSRDWHSSPRITLGFVILFPVHAYIFMMR